MQKAVAIVVVLVGAVVAERLGVLAELGNPSTLPQKLASLGAWGYVAFVLAYASLQPFGVPGTIFIFVAPLVWPWPVAFALSMIGTMAASVVGFSFARFIARDFIAKRIPERFRKYDDALENRAFLTVFLLRLVFWMPPLLHAFFGVSKVRFATHFWGSFFGYLLPIFFVSYFGQAVYTALKNAPPAVWVATVLVIATSAFTVWAVRRVRARQARAAGRASSDTALTKT